MRFRDILHIIFHVRDLLSVYVLLVSLFGIQIKLQKICKFDIYSINICVGQIVRHERNGSGQLLFSFRAMFVSGRLFSALQSGYDLFLLKRL